MYRFILEDYWRQKQKINPRYSLRSFARSLDIEPSTLSQIIRGKRKLPPTEAQKILSRLQLSPQIQQQFIASMDETLIHKSHFQKYLRTLEVHVDTDALYKRVFSSTLHMAMISLVDTKDFHDDKSWMANRLGTSVRKIKQILNDLIQVGLVIEANGLYKVAHPEIKTNDDVTDVCLQKAHLDELKFAIKSLKSHPVDDRDFTSITFAINEKKIKAAKVLIRSFLKQMEGLLESGEKTEVYQLNLQLFPLTKKKK